MFGRLVVVLVLLTAAVAGPAGPSRAHAQGPIDDDMRQLDQMEQDMGRKANQSIIDTLTGGLPSVFTDGAVGALGNRFLTGANMVIGTISSGASLFSSTIDRQIDAMNIMAFSGKMASDGIRSMQSSVGQFRTGRIELPKFDFPTFDVPKFDGPTFDWTKLSTPSFPSLPEPDFRDFQTGWGSGGQGFGITRFPDRGVAAGGTRASSRRRARRAANGAAPRPR